MLLSAIISIPLQYYQPMSNPIQQNDKTHMNMFSVHVFYKEVIQQMEQILLSEKRERYMLNAWDNQKATLFTHAVKYYLNHQPTLFNRSLQKYSNNQVQTIIPLKRKKRKMSTISGADQRKSHKSTNFKREPSVSGQKVKSQGVLKKSQSSKQPSIHQKNCQTASKVSTILKTQQVENQTIQKNSGLQVKNEEKQRQWDEQSDDLLNFQLYQRNIESTDPQSTQIKELEERKSVKSSVKDESVYYEQQQDDSSDEQSLGKFAQKAQKKTNALIFGNFLTRQLRHKAKQDKIELELSNCFIKMFKYGRDAFYPRMNLSLFKQQIQEINKPLGQLKEQIGDANKDK